MAEENTSGAVAPEETPVQTQNTQETPQSPEGGKKVVPIEVYETVKTDMLKYKQEMRTLKEQIEKIEQHKKETQETELKEKEEFKKLYEQKNQELESIQAQYEQTLINNELRLIALKNNIRDVDDIKLIDMSNIKLTDGKVEGVEESIKNLKEKKPYLFGSDQTQAPAVPGGNVSQAGGTATKYEDLLQNSKLMKDYMHNHPAEYQKLRDEYITRTRKKN